MYRRNARSDRRSTDGLYQARHHQWLQDRKKAAQESRRKLTLDELRQRAQEARRHDCEHTHVHPEMLLDLLDLRDRFALVMELIQLHHDMASKAPDDHKRRDRMLWTQTIPRHKRRE